MNIHDVQELWFQQDGTTCHTARATIYLLKYTFGDRLISRFGPVNWPPRSCDLTPLDYFLWGYVKSLVYADKPQTLDHLEDNIRRVIADIRPQMLEKVIENWTSRLDYIRARRGNIYGETCHTACATIDLLKDTFGDRLISRFGPVNWPPRSCDLTPLDYFLWGYVKSLVYADKPQTLDHLEDNIRRVIADIRPQMLENSSKIGHPDWTTSEPAVAVICHKSYLKYIYGETCHTACATIDLLKDTFGDRLISRFGLVNWPPRSCDLTPLDYFLGSYVKSLVYVDKPQTLDHLEDNIRRVIADIRPQMLEKVIENWTSRLDYIRARRGSHMP
ncbi:DUF4817 domain-containing protein [Trichonephila clavipes]|nr:DUF4817 domain-containing protein [Trichonephila clavipes]